MVMDKAEGGLRITPQLVLGVLVVLAGVVLTLDNFGFIYAEDYFRFWPVSLIVVGYLKLTQSQSGPMRLLSAALMLVGFLWTLDNLEVIDFSPENLWPLGIVILGTVLVWQALSRGRRRDDPDGQRHSSLAGVAVMGGFKRSINSSDFKGGELTAFMGGCEVDLSRASIASGEAVIDIFVMWGGIEMRVPEDWTVIIQAFPLMGGVVDNTRAPREEESRPKRLIIKGLVMMGGIELKN